MRARRTGWVSGLAAVALALFALPSLADSAKPKRVVTTFTILQDMAQNVAGERAIVDSLTRPGAEIHDYDPTPLDVVKAQAADLVLWNGLGLERWFERFFSGVRDVPSAVLSDGIEPIGIAEGPYADKPNPHSWMSPANAAIYVENIRKALSGLDPDGADLYRRNAATYLAKLKALDEPIRTALASIPADRRTLVTCEGAFSYLARNYGLKELYLWPINADEEGTPRQIKKVVDQVRRDKVPVVFCESTVSDRTMRQVARETRTRFGGTLFVDSLTDAAGVAPTFLKMLEYNADVIRRGFNVSN